ncbi:MAG: DUF2062 domain-containing protein [Gammaproteobacteria bacterium HGW-Gammaproteobacteria-8]|nr:MAG: DUF2062 domain-containing protein [Gammaproteobacteria bacterium HGW-Gammaproteobacteria-8]
MRWLRLQFLRRHRWHRSHVRGWLESHPRLVRVLERAGALHIDETTLARGVAVGLFIGMTPTVGIQTGMMLIAAFAFRANFFAAFLVSNVSNPLTMAPLYYGWNQLGHWLIDRLPIQPFQIDGIGEEIAFETVSMLLGSLVTAVPSAVLGYFGFLRLWRALDLRLPGQQAQVLGDESEQRSAEDADKRNPD